MYKTASLLTSPERQRDDVSGAKISEIIVETLRCRSGVIRLRHVTQTCSFGQPMNCFSERVRCGWSEITSLIHGIKDGSPLLQQCFRLLGLFHLEDAASGHACGAQEMVAHRARRNVWQLVVQHSIYNRVHRQNFIAGKLIHKCVGVFQNRAIPRQRSSAKGFARRTSETVFPHPKFPAQI